MDHGVRRHAKYSGSNAHRFSVCSGQVALAGKIGVDISGPDAEKGTAAHELLDICIKNNWYDTELCSNEYSKSVQHVLDYIAALRLQYPDLFVVSEIYRAFPQSVVPDDDAGGVIDVWCWSHSARIAWVIDFKNGAGETVDIEGNKQLLFYGTMALWNLSFNRAFLVVIQPNSFRGSEPREIEVTGLDLVEYQADIENAIRAAESKDAVLVPGEHCHRCPAGHGCLARERQAVAVLTGDDRPIREFDTRSLPLPADIPIERIGWIKQAAPFIRQWLKDVDAYAFQVALEGVHVPNFKLVEDEGQRRYKPGLTPDTIYRRIVEMSGQRLSIEQVMPQKLIAMTVAEKLLVETLRNAAPLGEKTKAVQQAHEMFADLLEKDTKGVVALVPDTDKRPAVNRTLSDFAGVVPAEAII